jgi:NEDD8-activating enzyme E1 regulatory subunit
VRESDLGVNFFLDESCLGRSRAECCTELLLELNPEVEGDWYPKHNESLDLKLLLESSPIFTVILYSFPVSQEYLALIEAYGRRRKTPLISVHSAGFYSYFHINLPGAFPVVDTHPDETATTDLRLLTPWDELTAFTRNLTKDIDNLDNHEHGHLPFVAILLYYLEVWKKRHGGADPSTYAEKVAFRKMVSEATRRNNPEGGEENFDEATAAVLKTIVLPALPSSVRQVFEYQHADPVSS